MAPPEQLLELQRSPTPNIMFQNDHVDTNNTISPNNTNLDNTNSINSTNVTNNLNNTNSPNNTNEVQIDLTGHTDDKNTTPAYQLSMFSTLIVVGLFISGFILPYMWIVSFLIFRKSSNPIAQSLSFLSLGCFVFIAVSYALVIGFAELVKMLIGPYNEIMM